MSLGWMTGVWQSPEPKGADGMMLLALADKATDEGLCWPSMSMLARNCGVSQRAARRTIHRLVRSQYVAIEQRPGRSTVYQLQWMALRPVVDDPPDADDRTDADDSPGVRKGKHGTPKKMGMSYQAALLVYQQRTGGASAMRPFSAYFEPIAQEDGSTMFWRREGSV